MKRIVLGILAHVDAGKTTLCESMLYNSGEITHLGRVDKGDCLLDTRSVERERGITVFSKQALFTSGETSVTLIDTPGHIDFASEAERALSILDYAVLVVSAPEGPMAHTVTLWKLLRARGIPTFIFVNKMDIGGRRRIDILDELKRTFGSGVTDFNLENEDKARFFEECASASEALMDPYFETGNIEARDIASSVRRCKIFPCFFGSALKLEGVAPLMRALDVYTESPSYGTDVFGAKVYKIATDRDGARLTYMKITGGSLAIKSILRFKDKNGEYHSERVEQIRNYSADKFKALKSADPGMVVAVPGLLYTFPSMGIGAEISDETEMTPVLDYRMIFENGTDIYRAYLDISVIGEEEPSLSLRYDERVREIRVRLMGEVQAQILAKLIYERFGYKITFDEGSILYKETITEQVYGAGHFEPLMHYAEVRLRLEPAPRGSGLVFASECPMDRLKGNWQRLILSHLEGRRHKGKLTGSHLTDMKITLIAGRAHPKHTEGGDFREATYRALRQGIMKSDSILLEPTLDFRIEVPANLLGRVMTDVSNMHGSCGEPGFSPDGSIAVISGNAPVYTMRSYAAELRAFSRGEGKINLSIGEYTECHNAEEIIAARGYDAENDVRNRADSIFCKNGSGYVVPWYEADLLMHTDAPDTDGVDLDTEENTPARRRVSSYRGTAAEDKELMAIFEKTYGKIKPRTVTERVENKAPGTPEKRKKQPVKGDEYLVIDGYNFIHAHPELSKLASAELSHAREALIRLISNYQGYKRCRAIIVFDAYKRKGGEGSIEVYGGVSVVYTKERQTADSYIEKVAYDLSGKHSVRVVTSDYEEQLVILGAGALRVSCREFIEELAVSADEIKDIIG